MPLPARCEKPRCVRRRCGTKRKMRRGRSRGSNPMSLYDSGATFDSGLRFDESITTIRKHMKAKVALGLSFLNGAQTAQLGLNIHTAMTGNASFTTPSPTLAELLTKVTAAT